MVGGRNSSAPIKPGDAIYLMSGDHGNVQIIGAVNEEFITVQASPGQIPVLRSLRVDGATKWMFIGLKIQGAGDGSTNSLPGQALIDFGHNAQRGSTSDIIFTDGSVSTADNVSNWTDLDWVKKPFMAGLRSGATCVTISNNHLFNLRNAIGIDGDRTLVAENRIDNFGNDGIELVASHVIVRNNMITNGRHTTSEPLHPDGIQGWTKNGVTNKNITIDGNTIINFGESNSLQGITIFDGRWDGLTISNNVVVTNVWHGVAIYGVENARIINNTVVASNPIKFPTWISVQNAKDGTPSRNVIVRNNIATQLTYAEFGVTADHNIIADRMGTNVSGKPTFVSKPGLYGDYNVIEPNIYATFVTVDHSRHVYDLRLKPNSPAIGAGNSELSPKFDIVGKRRTVPPDIGAYNH